ncbi:Cytochrome b-c1 complex subunit 7 [Nowakowskiella sp. JEL0407]|nr:Cytochrome b-c1 complex subunit 7 [Nowakowskiella sp. JEL0407]
MGYRKMGLVYDDLIPEENALVQEALRRLPPREFQDRTFRFRTAFALDVTQTELPKEYHVTAETDKPYLRPILAQVEREIATKQYFDNMTEIPAALAKRNRSS